MALSVFGEPTTFEAFLGASTDGSASSVEDAQPTKGIKHVKHIVVNNRIGGFGMTANGRVAVGEADRAATLQLLRVSGIIEAFGQVMCFPINVPI